MKKILLSLLAMTVIFVSYGFFSSISVQASRTPQIVNMGINDLEGIQVLDPVPDKITYGDDEPAPRLKINGKIYKPGQDFTYKYMFGNTYSSSGYMGLCKSGQCDICFDASTIPEVYDYLKELWGTSSLYYIDVASFNVEKVNLADLDYTIEDVVFDIKYGSYGNQSIPKFYINGKQIHGYKVTEYENNDKAGTAYAVCIPSSSSSDSALYGTVKIPYQVKPHPLNTDEFKISYYFPAGGDGTYTGSPIVPVPKVRIIGDNSDYKSDNYYVECEGDNVNAGQVNAKIIGKNNLTGEYAFTFNIKPRDINGVRCVFDEYEYTGYEIKPKPSSITYNDMSLKEGKDYKIVGYQDNIEFVNNFGYSYGKCIIEGLGNYKGERTCLFHVLRCDISKVDFDIAHVTYKFGNNYISDFAATAVYNGKECYKDTDYTVYLGKYNSDKYQWKITGQGNFTGYIYRDVDIDPRDINEESAILRRDDNLPVSSFQYTGEQIKPRISVGALTSGVDYKIVSYGKNINVGKGSLTIKGIGNYCGTRKVEFDITPCSISYASSDPIAVQFYDGSPVKPAVCLRYNGTLLTEGKDYDLSYSDNDRPGKGTVKVTGIGNFNSVKNITFKITDINYKIVVEDIPDQLITSPMESPCPIPTVTLDGTPLEYKTDFTVDYSFSADENFMMFGTAEIYVKDYDYVERKDFNILYDLNKLVNMSFEDMDYTGNPCEPEAQYTDDYDIVRDRDYRLTSANNINAGTASVTVEGIGIFGGSKTYDFKIRPLSIENAKASIPSQIAAGKPLTPSFDLKLDEKTLEKDTDYTVSYTDNVKVGTAKAVVTGIGNYTGSAEFTFKIVAPTATPTPIPTATNAPKISIKPTVTSAPEVTQISSKPTVTTAPAVTEKPSEDEDPKVQIMDFVKRIYIYVLDREPEEEGAAYWSEELWAFRRTGAEVAQGFIFSDEFVNRNTTDKEFVTILYKTFFGRDPEDDGINFWLGQLKSGTMDRVTVANGFIYSQEWADTCASYGIRSGGELKPNGTIEPTVLTYAFVERMYTTALGRGYDEEGRQYWASELANFNITGEQLGASFFLSDEMNGYNLSDAKFLDRLYQTFMNREADADGEAYWLSQMSAGVPRADIVFGFTRSPEFTDKCIEARILPY